MSEDRRTKAQLLAEIERLEEARREDKRRAVNVTVPEHVPEAEALAQCIRALDPLDSRSRSVYDPAASRGSIARLLKSLADKYGVEVFRTEHSIEPCERPHLDDLDPAALGSYLQATARPARRRGSGRDYEDFR
jgi:hypothetical protein